MTKSKGKYTRHKWSAQNEQLLREKYPTVRAIDIAQELKIDVHLVWQKAKRMGLSKAPEFYGSDLSGRTDGKRGAGTRFHKGQVSWNKGNKGQCAPGSEAGWFKPGTKPPNHLPVGFIRTNGDGYLDIKTEEGMRKWVPLHRWNWKQAHGEFPPRGMVLVFKDGNHLNCDISNLELVTRKELMLKNTLHNLPKEVTHVIQLRGALNRRINNLEKNRE